MRSLLRIVAIFILASSAFACRRSAPTSSGDGASAWLPTIQPVTSPAASTGASLAPQLTASSQGVILSWIEQTDGKATLRFAERRDSGWSAAMEVASGSDWFLSYADVPTVFRKADGTLVANWLVKTHQVFESYNLLLSYSRDNGRTWAAPFLPHHDNTQSQHGFASFFDVPGNGVGLVWLDGRQTVLDTTSPDGGAMTLRAATFDTAWKQTADDAVDVRVCECCPTTAAVTTEGVLTAFRDRSESEVRDIRIARLRNGRWEAGPLVHADDWAVFACPVNGPVLSARDRLVAAAWFTAKNDEGHAYAAFSSDSGQTWSAPIRLDETASLGHVDIELLEDGTAAAMWVEFANQRAQVRIRRVERGGGTSTPVVVTGSGAGRPTGVPRLSRRGEELIFAWTESEGAEEGPDRPLQIKTAVARVPRATAN